MIAKAQRITKWVWTHKQATFWLIVLFWVLANLGYVAYMEYQMYANSLHRSMERAFESLRASAKAGRCDGGIWDKAIWAGSARAENFAIVEPVGVEKKPALCAALAQAENMGFDLWSYGENGMVGVWRRTYPYADFSGTIVMYAKRPTPDQPYYKIVSWSAYPSLDGILRPRRDDE